MKTATPTTDDVADWKSLVLWARQHGVVLHELSVGVVRGVITDTSRQQPVEKSEEILKQGLYAHYGGVVLESAIQESAKAESGVEDDEGDE